MTFEEAVPPGVSIPRLLGAKSPHLFSNAIFSLIGRQCLLLDSGFNSLLAGGLPPIREGVLPLEIWHYEEFCCAFPFIYLSE